MTVCFCNGVSDRDIKRAIDNGARSRRDVAVQSGAGTCCGGCADSIDNLLLESRSAESSASEAPRLPVQRLARAAS